MSHCPLCQAPECTSFWQDKKRAYVQCASCDLVFVPPAFFLSSNEEKEHYDYHENSPDDLGYRGFLSRLFVPLNQRIPAGSIGLDFGSGPGPTLSVMFNEAGHQMSIYDPFYAPDPVVFEQTYDFITASEVVEHLHRPQFELERLWSCLRPGGWLGIMTKRVIDLEAFKTWHYKNDPTHVCFFSTATFEFLAHKWEATLSLHGADVVIFRKPMDSPIDLKNSPPNGSSGNFG